MRLRRASGRQRRQQAPLKDRIRHLQRSAGPAAAAPAAASGARGRPRRAAQRLGSQQQRQLYLAGVGEGRGGRQLCCRATARGRNAGGRLAKAVAVRQGAWDVAVLLDLGRQHGGARQRQRPAAALHGAQGATRAGRQACGRGAAGVQASARERRAGRYATSSAPHGSLGGRASPQTRPHSSPAQALLFHSGRPQGAAGSPRPVVSLRPRLHSTTPPTAR